MRGHKMWSILPDLNPGGENARIFAIWSIDVALHSEARSVFGLGLVRNRLSCAVLPECACKLLPLVRAESPIAKIAILRRAVFVIRVKEISENLIFGNNQSIWLR